MKDDEEKGPKRQRKKDKKRERKGREERERGRERKLMNKGVKGSREFFA